MALVHLLASHMILNKTGGEIELRKGNIPRKAPEEVVNLKKCVGNKKIQREY